MAEWQARTSRSIERLGWFRAADRARYAALLIHGQRLYDDGRNADSRLGSLAVIGLRLAETSLALARLDAEDTSHRAML